MQRTSATAGRRLERERQAKEETDARAKVEAAAQVQAQETAVPDVEMDLGSFGKPTPPICGRKERPPTRRWKVGVWCSAANFANSPN